jgi:hypothetical protein
MKTSVQQAHIIKLDRTAAEQLDLLAVEEPLEIRLGPLKPACRTPFQPHEKLRSTLLFTQAVSIRLASKNRKCMNNMCV